MCFVPVRMGLLSKSMQNEKRGSIQEGQIGCADESASASCRPAPHCEDSPAEQIQHLNISAGICLCKTRSVCRRPVSSALLAVVLLGQKLRPNEQKPLTV